MGAATCGGIFDNDLEWDHVARLQQTVKGKPQVFQAICASCHLDKSTQEGSQPKLIESRFSKRARDAYAVTPRPPLWFGRRIIMQKTTLCNCWKLMYEDAG